MSAKFIAPKEQVVDPNCGGGPGACSIAKQKADIADAMEYRNMQGGNTAVERVGLVDNASTQHANANIKKIMEAGEQLEADAKYDGDVGKIKGGGKGKKVKKVKKGGEINVVKSYVKGEEPELYNRITKNDASNINEDIETLTNIYLDKFKGSDTYPTPKHFINALFEGTQNHESEYYSELLQEMDELLKKMDEEHIGGGLLKLLGLKKSKKSPKKKAAKKTKKATKKAAKKTKKVAKKAKKAPKKAAKKKTKKAAKKGKK